MLCSLAFSARYLSRLEFNIVNALEMGEVAVYNGNAPSNTDCRRTQTLQNELAVLVRSGMSNSLLMDGNRLTRAYYLKGIWDDDNIHLLYYKPSGARCYYWAKIDRDHQRIFTFAPQNVTNLVQFQFAVSPDLPRTTLKLYEARPVQGGVIPIDELGFYINGSSVQRRMQFFGDEEHPNSIQYRENRNGQDFSELRQNPFRLASGSQFRGLSQRSVMLSIYAFDQ